MPGWVFAYMLATGRGICYNKLMLFIDFISWWYADGLKGVMQRLGLQLAKITDFFSVGLLIKTLFTPFRLIDSYSAGGQSLDDKIRAGLDKLIARFIGGLIRSTVLLFAIIVIFTTIVIDILKIILWLMAPSLPIIGAVLLAIGVTL